MKNTFKKTAALFLLTLVLANMTITCSDETTLNGTYEDNNDSLIPLNDEFGDFDYL